MSQSTCRRLYGRVAWRATADCRCAVSTRGRCQYPREAKNNR